MKRTIILISVLLAAVMILPVAASAYDPEDLPVAGVDVASDEVIFVLDYTNPDVAAMELFPIYAENYEELNENHTYGERKAGPISEFAELIGIPFPVTFADMLDTSIPSTATPEGKYIPSATDNTTFCIKIKNISVHEAIKILGENPYIKYAEYNYIYQPEVGTTGNNSLPFTDVMTGKWYTEPVTRLYEMGIVKGVSKDKFAPSQVTTRAMMTEILYRVDKKFGRASADAAKPEGYKPFTDVEGKWYYGAADWANLTGVVRGYPDGSFRGDRPITRAEAATILYRYLKFAGLETEVISTDAVNRFSDADSIPSWAIEAVNYLYGTSVMTGMSYDKFDPNGQMTRAMVATVAYRVVKEFEKQEAEPVVTEPVPVESLFNLNGEKYGRLIASSESAEDAIRVCTRHFTDMRYEGYHNIVTDCSVIYESDILYGLNVKWEVGKGKYEENVISIKKNIADISVNNVVYGDKDSFRILTDSKEQIEKVLLYLFNYKYFDLTLSNGYELAENESEYILNADTLRIVYGDWGLEDTYHYYNVTLTLDKTTRYVECQKQEISHH